MIFESDPEHIQALDSMDLVHLMKRLLLAESQLAGIPLRGASVPLQITVPDGGEDGRIEWSGGRQETAYFPSRFTLFQSKAQNLTAAIVRNEVLKNAKGKKGKATSGLSEAIKDVLEKRGAYVIFCRTPFIGKRRDNLAAAVKAAIVEGGGDPDQAAAIEIYDANTIADWVNSHPPVALWLASKRLGRPLHGFQTHKSWGRAPEIAAVPWQPSETPRFAPQNRSVPLSERIDPALPFWTHARAAAAVREFLSNDGAVIRVAGPSGYGKTRFGYETLSGNSRALADLVDASSVMYVDGSISGTEAVNLALEMAETQTPGILVIDECRDDLHWKLAQMVQRAGSKLRLVTMDIETKVSAGNNLLSIRIEKTDGKHIQAIAKGVAPTLGDIDASFIAELAEGFPRMAVLAAQQNGDGRQTLQSVDQILDRIIWGSNVRVNEAQRAIEIASLFDWFGLEGRVSAQVDWIAKELGNMTGAMFAEHLRSFFPRGVLVRRGDFAQIGPVPLAARLGLHRLQMMSADQLVRLFHDAPSELKISFLRRLKWLDTSPVARHFVERILAPELLGNLAALNTDFGSKLLDYLVHVNPDAVAATVERVFGQLTLEELQAVRDGRRHLVWTLEKLVFPKSSFDRAATLLRRLATVETEKISNNATGIFKQLFHLYLSGTEAAPSRRLLVLDEGLSSTDAREREISVDALGAMLETAHFTRFGGSDQIGSDEPMVDWQPKTNGEIWNFFRSAISRLLTIATRDDPLAAKAKNLLGSHIRGLLRGLPFDGVKAMIETMIAHDGVWIEAIQEVSSWLFFDRNEAPRELATEVRRFYDTLLPTDLIELAILYTEGWQNDLYDPNTIYDSAKHDFEYSIRQAQKIAKQIAGDPVLLNRAVDRLACSGGHTLFPFARELVAAVDDPTGLFSYAVEVAERNEASANRGFFSGLISGADGRDHALAQSLVRMALKATRLKREAISFIGSGQLRADDLALVVSLLQSADVSPSETESLSYGRGLDHLSDAEIMPLFLELEQHSNDGLWTILGMANMLLFGGRQPTKELAKFFKRVLINPALVERVRHNMDGHHLAQVVERVAAFDEIKASYAKKLAKQLLRICRKNADRTFYDLDDPVRKSLTILARLYPAQVWEEVAKKLTSKSWDVRFYSERLLVSRHGDNYLALGIAFDVPPATFLAWVRAAPQERAAKAVDWLPVAVRAEDGILHWHAEMEAFVIEFGDQPEALQAIAKRLRPTSWWGSLAPHLEAILPLLEQWTTHQSPKAREFANGMIVSLRRQIVEERKRSEEDVVRFT